jgi:hypothetical protein
MLDYTTRIIDYDETRFPFRALVAAHFGRDLAQLHEGAPAIGRLQPGMDTQTPMHKHFYSDDGPFLQTFLAVYRAFVYEVFRGESALLYQRIPTFRVHLPGNVATGNFHRDADFGHNRAELNVLVALTPMHDTNSVWIESTRVAEDTWNYEPVVLQPGQALIFHGAVLSHGSLPNLTGVTRASFDARVLPRQNYQPGARTVNQGMAMDIGTYWEAL